METRSYTANVAAVLPCPALCACGGAGPRLTRCGGLVDILEAAEGIPDAWGVAYESAGFYRRALPGPCSALGAVYVALHLSIVLPSDAAWLQDLYPELFEVPAIPLAPAHPNWPLWNQIVAAQSDDLMSRSDVLEALRRALG